MDGALAQSIALALHGSAWLNRRGAPPTLETNNSTFRYVSHVEFEDLSGGCVDTVIGWLEQLTAAGVTEIDMLVDDDPAVGLWTATAEGARVWRAEWRTGHHDPLVAPPPNPRPWSVTYRESPTPARPERPALDPARRALIQAITIAVEFARQQDMHPWDAVLAQARDLDEATHPQPPFHPDMAPPGGLSPERQRLLAMATGAHVFGGMGSWNDVSFADHHTQRTYQEVSDRLFTAVMRGFVACVNGGRIASPDPSN